MVRAGAGYLRCGRDECEQHARGDRGRGVGVACVDSQVGDVLQVYAATSHRDIRECSGVRYGDRCGVALNIFQRKICSSTYLIITGRR